MAFLQRLFMNPHQKRLTDPSQYRAPLDRAAIQAEIEAGLTGVKDHETYPSMLRSVREVNEGGPLTIAAVGDAFDSMRSAMQRPHDRCYHDFGAITLAGDNALLNYLVARANQISAGIQPGAKAELGRAFD